MKEQVEGTVRCAFLSAWYVFPLLDPKEKGSDPKRDRAVELY